MNDFPILFEDEGFLVINKPAGIVVNRAETVKELTIQDWMDEKYHIQTLLVENDQHVFKERSGIVHRIDKETSGCLLLAKNPVSFFALQAGFKEKKVKKNYVALLHGKLVPQAGTVNAPVGRLPWNREQFGVVPGGKESITHYKVQKYYKNDAQLFSLVELDLESGRTHQIRVHMKYLGFPLVGDYLYAGRKQQRDDREWCPRVFLHAAKLAFGHPNTAEIIIVTAPLPPELAQVLSILTPLAN